jgi:hypothetical protein
VGSAEPLTPQDRDELLRLATRLCSNQPEAAALLRQVGFPVAMLPAWGATRPADWWSQIFEDFDNGIVETPYHRLIAELQLRYRANAALTRLAARYPLPTPAAASGGVGSAGAAAAPTCHVIVQAGSERERAAAAASLREVGLDPREVWSTGQAMSYAVGSTDVPMVREALGRTDLGWTVVAPGQPDYLLREFYVDAPDGSRHRVVDAPAQQTLRTVADQVMGRYGTEFPGRPVAVTVGRDGRQDRVNPDYTLHEAGLRDGDEIRVDVAATAGGDRRFPAGGHVFLCHSSQDKDDVRALYKRLRADGLTPWLDEEDLLPGQDWELEIRKAIKDSAAVLVVLSADAVARKGYAQKEIRMALDVADLMPEGSVFVIPARLDECAVPDRLNRWQWIDLFQPDGYSRLTRLLRALTSGSGR